MFGRYHIGEPAAFYEKTSSWSVAQDPGSSVNVASTITTTILPNGQTSLRVSEARIEPKYMLIRLPGQTLESFVLLRPFVPYSEDDSKKTLTSFMVADSEQASYGKLTVYQMPSGTNIDGPSIVNSNILASPQVAQQLTLLNQQGSRAQLGAMMLVPVNNSIVYVRPLYVSSDNNTQIPELKKVIAVFGGEVVMRDTLRDALRVLFPGANPQTFESGSIIQENTPVPDGSLGPLPGSTTTTTVPSTGNETKDQLIDSAAKALVDADVALRNGDLATYQAKVREAQVLLAQAQAMSDGATGAATTTSAPSATTTSLLQRSATPASFLLR
jgi:uncharacterized membrane protein (UPF0182 family)